MGEEGPQGVQSLLTSAVWDAEAVCDDLRAYVVEHLGDATERGADHRRDELPQEGAALLWRGGAVLRHAGAQRNCQVGVFLGYASAVGMAFLDSRALPAPLAGRRIGPVVPARGCPPAQRFATKGELAKRLLARAFAAGVPGGVGGGRQPLWTGGALPRLSGGAGASLCGGHPARAGCRARRTPSTRQDGGGGACPPRRGCAGRRGRGVRGSACMTGSVSPSPRQHLRAGRAGCWCGAA